MSDEAREALAVADDVAIIDRTHLIWFLAFIDQPSDPDHWHRVELHVDFEEVGAIARAGEWIYEHVGQRGVLLIDAHGGPAKIQLKA